MRTGESAAHAEDGRGAARIAVRSRRPTAPGQPPPPARAAPAGTRPRSASAPRRPPGSRAAAGRFGPRRPPSARRRFPAGRRVPPCSLRSRSAPRPSSSCCCPCCSSPGRSWRGDAADGERPLSGCWWWPAPVSEALLGELAAGAGTTAPGTQRGARPNAGLALCRSARRELQSRRAAVRSGRQTPARPASSPLEFCGCTSITSPGLLNGPFPPIN